MKDELEIAKNSIELAKDFIKQIINPSLSELGELFADNVRYLRFKNQIKILNKAQALLSENDSGLKKIPLKILVPMLESASLEEDEALQDKWSSLLANAADSDRELLAPIVYTSILNNLTPNEAIALDYLESKGTVSCNELYQVSGISESHLDNLFRLKLIKNDPPEITMEQVADWEMKILKDVPKVVESNYVTLTFLGNEFVLECRY